MQKLTDISGCIIGNDLAAVHHDGPVCIGENILQTVLGDNNGSAQFNIDLTNSIQKIGCGNGVKLAGRLVQDQHLRLHGHDGCQVQQLLLTAGQSGHILMKPIGNTKIAGHFCHTGAHGLLVTAQGFQTESQLMPHLIGDDLIIGILHHIADFGSLIPLIDFLERHPVKQDLTAFLAVRRKDRFQLTQKRCFTAAGLAAEDDIFSLFNGQVHTVQRFFAFGCGICKCQIFDLEMCHWMASFICNAVGIRR